MTATAVQNNQLLDKESLKIAFLDLLKTDKSFAYEISQFFLRQSEKVEIMDIDEEDPEFDALTQRNFERYEKTFKALA